MIFLLDSATKIAEISDLISTKWLEILGWISIPTIVTTLICCIFKLVTSAVSKKIASKNIKPLASKVEEAKEFMRETANELKTLFENNINHYADLTEQKINDAFEKYEKAKQEAYQKIMQLEEAIEKPNEIVGTVQEQPIVEEIKEEPIIEEPIVEEVKEEIVDAVDPLTR